MTQDIREALAKEMNETQGLVQFLTPLEEQVILAFEIAFNYPGRPESEKSDNATVIDVRDVSAKTGLDIKTVKGVFGSLYKKGILEDWNEPDMVGVSFITNDGIDAYYQLAGA